MEWSRPGNSAWNFGNWSSKLDLTLLVGHARNLLPRFTQVTQWAWQWQRQSVGDNVVMITSTQSYYTHVQGPTQQLAITWGRAIRDDSHQERNERETCKILTELPGNPPRPSSNASALFSEGIYYVQATECHSPGILVSTHQILGVRFTCTRARYVVIMEPALLKSSEEQSAGRIHRIGQHYTTTVWRLYNNTSEAKRRILQRHQQRQGLREQQ
ncbi:hypothetical protein PENANT_c001G11188 [Penicillium antarcticum]|uniref:Helicase C-terminal domain-containing protein n=1 Tax=Penicillium antarcticum TaxID=416450 RepID=A0A1V6QNK1_9EURO|nr:hypothetical protein PENANT_c001G11188 [Penicillium antarcticum]